MYQPSLKIAGATDIGQKRTRNEDFLMVDEDLCIVALADGMGGHNAGEIASQMVASSIVVQLSLWLKKSKPRTIKRNIQKAITRFVNIANSEIFEAAAIDSTKRGMGTTLVAIVYQEGLLTVAHVGDSRAYLFRNNQLIALTKDHSKVQDLIDAGLISIEQAENSRFKNILTRAIGVSDKVTVDFNKIALKVNDKILICSDGLTNMLTDVAIKEVLSMNETLPVLLRNLISNANHLGGQDNITVAIGSFH